MKLSVRSMNQVALSAEEVREQMGMARFFDEMPGVDGEPQSGGKEQWGEAKLDLRFNVEKDTMTIGSVGYGGEQNVNFGVRVLELTLSHADLIKIIKQALKSGLVKLDDLA